MKVESAALDPLARLISEACLRMESATTEIALSYAQRPFIARRARELGSPQAAEALMLRADIACGVLRHERHVLQKRGLLPKDWKPGKEIPADLLLTFAAFPLHSHVTQEGVIRAPYRLEELLAAAKTIRHPMRQATAVAVAPESIAPSTTVLQRAASWLRSVAA